eukprot:403354397
MQEKNLLQQPMKNEPNSTQPQFMTQDEIILKQFGDIQVNYNAGNAQMATLHRIMAKKYKKMFMGGMGNQDFNQQPFYQQPNQYQQPLNYQVNQQWGMQQNQMYNAMPMVDQFGQQMFDQFGNVMYQQPGAFAQQQFVGLGQTQIMTNTSSNKVLDKNIPSKEMTQNASNTKQSDTTKPETESYGSISSSTNHLCTSTFPTAISVFVPEKKKIVKTEDAFPVLGTNDNDVQKNKKLTIPQKKEDDRPKKEIDPCMGKAQEFFTLVPMNPMFQANPFANPLTLNEEQYNFMYVYYPEYAPNPVDLFNWLYSQALYNEEQVKYQKIEEENDNAYLQKPKISTRHDKLCDKMNQYESEDEEEKDSYYFQNNRSKKKSAKLARNEISQQLQSQQQKQFKRQP